MVIVFRGDLPRWQVFAYTGEGEKVSLFESGWSLDEVLAVVNQTPGMYAFYARPLTAWDELRVYNYAWFSRNDMSEN